MNPTPQRDPTRPDWRAALVVMAVVLAAALALLVAQHPATSPTDPQTVAATRDEGSPRAADDEPDDEGQNGRDGDGEEGRDGRAGERQKGSGGQDGDQEEQDGGGQDGGVQDDEEFPGRDQIGEAEQDEYVDIGEVASNSGVGEGGDFSGGSYGVECSLSDHHNSDNPILAPNKRNGAQHTHDYAGNTSANAASDEDSLLEADTTCSNGDQSPIFWPVLRDLAGTGPDLGLDGGSLDGNVGSFLVPTALDFTFHGHGSRRTEPMPLNMTLVTGSAKASTEDGEGANAKYSCTGLSDRVTDRYPLCPDGSNLQRLFDFPSCWNGRDLDSEDHISHIAFPDEAGECDEDEVPVPALRITLTYDQPQDRGFAIDSFPEQQHDPITDHALLEYLSSERRAQAGADCINGDRQCTQGQADNVAFPTDPRDEVAGSLTFAHAFATHATKGTHHGAARAGHATDPPRSSVTDAPFATPRPPLGLAPMTISAPAARIG